MISFTGSEEAVSGKARDARRAVRPPADIDALLSPEQVARRCGLSRRAVYRTTERGEFRASPLCSRIRIHPAEGWVEENQIEPSPRRDPRYPRAPRRCDPRTASVAHARCSYSPSAVQRRFQLGSFQQVTGDLKCQVEDAIELSQPGFDDEVRDDHV
jgi:hypothetical protein